MKVIVSRIIVDTHDEIFKSLSNLFSCDQQLQGGHGATAPQSVNFSIKMVPLSAVTHVPCAAVAGYKIYSTSTSFGLIYFSVAIVLESLIQTNHSDWTRRLLNGWVELWLKR